ncbi:hypothetical protein GCM10027598_46020 [Amycolatopsis oliviviridis]|uniref:Uncharacterized protein n=1 Tax=Amycolatopsis oliviviridis TaxID=1471590 RepID=A0ABQ3L8S0_9PSEU|nr:hypothetical protein GCM10017790_15820 [Amycolatopsis oliviviridis]
MSTVPEVSGQHEGPLAEFVALRAEMQLRAETQWKIMSLQITGSGAIFGFAMTSQDRVPLLLIVPLTSYMLGTRHAMHAHAIMGIAKYIRTHLSMRVPGGLNWEDWVIEKRRVETIKLFEWGNPNMLIFPGAGALALIVLIAWPFVSNKWTQQAVLVSVLETLAWVLGLALTAVCVRTLWRSSPYRLTVRK